MSAGLRRAAVACVLLALALVVLDAAVANVALPAIARSLRVTSAEAVRVITAYQLGIVVALLPCAALGEGLGLRRVYTAGVALFVGASLLCAAAPSLATLVAARFAQGLGGAAVMALGVALLRRVVAPDALGDAIGWNALVVGLASAAGPTLGTLVLSVASWHWLFAVNLPLGALALLATRALPRSDGSGRRLDLVSAALNATAFGALVTAAELAPTRGAVALVALTTAVVAAVALVRRELPRSSPMIPLDLLRDGSFRVSVVASLSCFVGQGAAMVSLPFHLQHGLGLDTLHAGLLITPWPLTHALVSPLVGRLTGRVRGAWLSAAGGAMLSLGLAALAHRPTDDSPLALAPFVALCGAGFALFQVPNNRNMLLSAPEHRSGAAGGVQSAARLTGQTLGGVLVTLLFTATSRELAPRIGLGIAAALTLSAGLVSLLRASPRDDAAATQRGALAMALR